MPDRLSKLIATFFYVGELPVAPGSIASIVGLFLAVGLSSWPIVYFLAGIAVTALGFLACQNIERILNEKDPSRVVVDEVAGSFIAFYQLPHNPSILITAYFLYRAFDMFKIFPVNKFDQSPGASGIMLDDLFAGLYTTLVMHAALLIYTPGVWS